MSLVRDSAGVKNALLWNGRLVIDTEALPMPSPRRRSWQTRVDSRRFDAPEPPSSAPPPIRRCGSTVAGRAVGARSPHLDRAVIVLGAASLGLIGWWVVRSTRARDNRVGQATQGRASPSRHQSVAPC